MKHAFSFIEIIIVVLIIGIIASVSVYKLFLTTQEANVVKIKTDIVSIQNAIVKRYNERILSGESASYEEVLDQAMSNQNQALLFDNVLSQPLISTNQSELRAGAWIKTGQKSYEIVLSATQKIEFLYDSIGGTFECNFETQGCKELYQ